MLFGCYRNNTIIYEPRPFEKSWQDPETKETFSGFDLLYPEDLEELGVYPSIVNTPIYNKYCEKIVDGTWSFDESSLTFVKNDYVEYLSFLEALSNSATELDKNREKYETSGFVYDYYGLSVIILTDKESSQPKLNASYIKAKEGARFDSDVWKFSDLQGNLVVVQLSNSDLIIIADYVFRKIQDSFNLTSQIFWQMLGCGNVETLKTSIENGSINLNPWNV